MIFVGNQLPSSSQKGLPCQAHSAWEHGSQPQNPQALLVPPGGLSGSCHPSPPSLWTVPGVALPLPPCPLDSLRPFLLSKWSLSSLPFERTLTLTLLKISLSRFCKEGVGSWRPLLPRRNAREKECGLQRSRNAVAHGCILGATQSLRLSSRSVRPHKQPAVCHTLCGLPSFIILLSSFSPSS